MCGKQTTFEGGMRTPTIAWWSRGFPDMSHDGQRPEGRVSQYVGTQMDFLPTLADLAGARLPPSLMLDGQSVAGILLGEDDSNTGHPVYFYRGNLLYAVRWKQYKVMDGGSFKEVSILFYIKAHFWTWTTPPEELERGTNRIQFSVITILVMSGIDHCPGSFVENVTTTEMRHHGDTDPVIFHLGRDPGEKFPLGKNSPDYKRALASISNIVKSIGN